VDGLFLLFKSELPFFCHSLTHSFLVHASEQTKDGRYYSKTVDELAKSSLVRDRTGQLASTDDNRSPSPPPPTADQVKVSTLASTWGLDNSDKASSTRDEEDDDEEGDSDNERHQRDEEEEDYDDDKVTTGILI
jgi:hypothetical protein